MIGTMGAAHCENLIGIIILAAWSLSSSTATLPHSKNGNCQAWRIGIRHFPPIEGT